MSDQRKVKRKKSSARLKKYLARQKMSNSNARPTRRYQYSGNSSQLLAQEWTESSEDGSWEVGSWESANEGINDNQMVGNVNVTEIEQLK